MSESKRILLLQTAFLGDAILTTPLLRAIKQTYPKAEIDLLTIPASSTIFQANPHINDLLIFDKKRILPRIISFFSLIQQIKKKKYDLAISAQISFTSSLLMKLPGIPIRIGFPRQKLLTHPVSIDKGIPVAKRYLKLMNAISDQEFSSQTELFWDIETDGIAEALIKKNFSNGEIIVGIAPGSIWRTKRWLPEYFSELIVMLSKNGVKVVLIGGKDDIELCNNIASNSRKSILNLAGKLSLMGSAALIKRLNLLVTNDSAPMHLANAVETDVVAIFGPTVKRFGFYPFRENDRVLEIEISCRPCGKHGGNTCPQKHFRCMKAITPQIVYSAIMEHLNINE